MLNEELLLFCKTRRSFLRAWLMYFYMSTLSQRERAKYMIDKKLVNLPRYVLDRPAHKQVKWVVSQFNPSMWA